MDCTRWSLSPDGEVLTLHAPGEDMVFRRRFGTGTTLVGVWHRTVVDAGAEGVRELEEEVYLRADGTYAWHFMGEFETSYGRYSVSGDQLTTWELRALVDCEGANITFSQLWGGKLPGTLALDGDRLTITSPEGVQTFDRVPCT